MNLLYLKEFQTLRSIFLDLKVSSWLCSILHPNEYSVKLQFHDFICIRWQHFTVFTKSLCPAILCDLVGRKPITFLQGFMFFDKVLSEVVWEHFRTSGVDYKLKLSTSMFLEQKTFRCLKLKTNFYESSGNSGKKSTFERQHTKVLTNMITV